MKKETTALIILDGWGHRESSRDNAIASGRTPAMDNLRHSYPHTLIQASSSFVGLPDGQMGNSEVGHMNIGAGRTVYQDLTRIDKALSEGDFNQNTVLCRALDETIARNKAVHIMGLLSSGGVHSHEDHILAMIDMAIARGVKRIYLHAFLDGRDTAPQSAEASLVKAEKKLKQSGLGYIASIIGRYYAMDRDQRWERIASSYDLITRGVGEFIAADALSGLQAAYERDESDEFVKATSIIPAGHKAVTVENGDAVIFMNFRSDRARQLSYAFTDPHFTGFKRRIHPDLSNFVTLTQYASDIEAACAYPQATLSNTLGEVISRHGKTQLRITETEKYAHVTFFFNGGREEPFEGEERCMIKSPDVATYDLQPEMSAPELTDRFAEAIESGKYDLIICNYANSDMVGHTGNFEAAVKAVEAVDQSIGRLINVLKKANGQCLITADHGNAEIMKNHETGQAHTAHTCEPVPLIYFGKNCTKLNDNGRLSDLAPTILELMGIKQPDEMTGRSLIAK